MIGLTSAGSGTLIAIGLIAVFRLTPQRVVGTDVFHAAILLWAAGVAHWIGGNVDFGLAGNILVGSIPGVWLGSHWSVRVEPAVLRGTLAIVLIGAGLALLIKAGLDLPVAVIVPFPLAVIALLVVTIARDRRAKRDAAWPRRCVPRRHDHRAPPPVRCPRDGRDDTRGHRRPRSMPWCAKLEAAACTPR